MKNKKTNQNSKSTNLPPNTQVIDEPERLLEGLELLKKNHPGLTLDQIGELFFNRVIYKRKFRFPKK